jgi:hypothetical protein
MKHLCGDPRQFTAFFALLAPILLPACLEARDLQSTDRTAVVAGPAVAQRYLGQTPPGGVPQPFAPGVVSTGAVELNSVFSPDGREFFFSRLIDGPDEQPGYPGRTRPILHHTVYRDGAWTEPRPLRLFADAPDAWAADMAVSPDGQLLYFMGVHPVDEDRGRSDPNLWVSRRLAGGWSFAEPLPAPVNTEAREVYSSVVGDGSLYFTSNRPGGLARTGSDLYRARRLSDGTFGEPVNVGPPVNSSHGVGDTVVAPDERFMILASSRPGGHGAGDLYVSFRKPDGNWDEPANLGADVNSSDHDYCPMLTPDGKYLLFSRRRSDPPDAGWAGVIKGDVYWVDASVIERLRPASW